MSGDAYRRTELQICKVEHTYFDDIKNDYVVETSYEISDILDGLIYSAPSLEELFKQEKETNK
jgi:CTP:phosphocholine cytidylyltransferase-like protein